MGASKALTLSRLESQIVESMQQEFPLVPRPYHELAELFGSTEETVFHHFQQLHQRGLFRRFGASINSRQLGFVSMLVAIRVHEECIMDVARIINGFNEVTHNYLRDGEYNMWFTVIAPDEPGMERILKNVEETPGVERLMRLPARRVFKINVKFPVIDVGESHD